MLLFAIIYMLERKEKISKRFFESTLKSCTGKRIAYWETRIWLKRLLDKAGDSILKVYGKDIKAYEAVIMEKI